MFTVINFDDISEEINEELQKYCKHWTGFRIKYYFLPEFAWEDLNPTWLSGRNGSEDLFPIINYLRNNCVNKNYE